METAQKAEKADDIARGRKKDVKSFFQSKSNLKKAAGKLSVKQDEVAIRSTGARNDYILSLATVNAHQHQYFKNDLPVSYFLQITHGDKMIPIPAMGYFINYPEVWAWHGRTHLLESWGHYLQNKYVPLTMPIFEKIISSDTSCETSQSLSNFFM